MNISKYLSTPLLILTILLTTLWSVHTLHAQSSGYTPVSVNSPTNTSLKVTATPLELNNTTNMWSYKIDWKRTRNAQGSISIAEESSPTTKVLSLSPASQEGTQTVTLKPSTTYRVKFYSTPNYTGTAILSRRMTTLSIYDEEPDVENIIPPVSMDSSITNLQSRISELLRMIEQLRGQIGRSVSSSSTATSTATTTNPLISLPQQPVACTMEARLCPDGITYVGRTGPQCEFGACPVKKCDTGLLYMPSCSGVPVQNPNTCEITCQSSAQSARVTITTNYSEPLLLGSYSNLSFQVSLPQNVNPNPDYTFKLVGSIPGMIFENMWCDQVGYGGICPKMVSVSSVMYLDGRPTQVGIYPITLVATDQYGNTGSKTINIEVVSLKPLPLITQCLYAAPPDGCSYIPGPNYNPQTTCGMILSCNAETACQNVEVGVMRTCLTGYVSKLNPKTCIYECAPVGSSSE